MDGHRFVGGALFMCFFVFVSTFSFINGFLRFFILSYLLLLANDKSLQKVQIIEREGPKARKQTSDGSSSKILNSTYAGITSTI